MVAACGILVGISYLMLDVLSNVVKVPQTPVEAVESQGEMVIPLGEGGLSAMQVSADGRYLAYIENTTQGQMGDLVVVEISSEARRVFSQGIQGRQLAWLGITQTLVYEDQGDIFRLEVPKGSPVNLTASPDNDSDPLPSPDGSKIIWMKQAAGVSQPEGNFWLMDADGGNKKQLAGHADLPVWDPLGATILSLGNIMMSAAGGSDTYFLQTIEESGSSWDYYAECDRKPLYLWWPEKDALYYVAPYPSGGNTGAKGVWFKVEDPNSVKRVASTVGLSADESYYQFFPSRKSELLAYVGEKGLEYIDMGAKLLYRYNQVDARVPLAWDEAAGYLYYCGEDGIYRVSLGRSGS
jgi:hypothetical protein